MVYFKRIFTLLAVCLFFTACNEVTSIDEPSEATDEKEKPSVATSEKEEPTVATSEKEEPSVATSEKDKVSDSLTLAQVLDAFKKASLPYETEPLTDPTYEFGTYGRGYVEPEISAKISIPDGVTDKKVEGYILVYTKKNLLEHMKTDFETTNKQKSVSYLTHIYTIKNVLVVIYGSEHMTQEKFEKYTKALEVLK